MAARSESAWGYVRVNCPACVERAGKFDRQRSLSVNTGNGWWLCHRCGWRGRLAGYDDDSDAWEDPARRLEEDVRFFPDMVAYMEGQDFPAPVFQEMPPA